MTWLLCNNYSFMCLVFRNILNECDRHTDRHNCHDILHLHRVLLCKVRRICAVLFYYDCLPVTGAGVNEMRCTATGPVKQLQLVGGGMLLHRWLAGRVMLGKQVVINAHGLLLLMVQKQLSR